MRKKTRNEGENGEKMVRKWVPKWTVCSVLGKSSEMMMMEDEPRLPA